MKKLDCGECTTCCQWGSDTTIRPLLTSSERLTLTDDFVGGHYVLKAKDNGDCFYLGETGCTIYKTRPEQCKEFDCRKLYNEMKGLTYMKVLFMGKAKSDD